MNWKTFKTEMAPGFRFNLTDIVVIASVSAFSYYLYLKVPGSSFFYLPLYIIFTFFLFCNVFRLTSIQEAIWYIPFTLFAAFSFTTGSTGRFWIVVLSVFEPLKLILIIFRIRSGSYSGAFYKMVNNEIR